MTLIALLLIRVVTTANHKILQFLDLMNDYDFYYDDSAEKEDVQFRLRTFIKDNNISPKKIAPYLDFFPDSIYKALYNLEVENVLA